MFLFLLPFHLLCLPLIAHAFRALHQLRRPAPSLAVSTNDLQTASDLTNHALWCTFTGFGTENATCALVLKPNFKVEYSRGISSYSEGFWRVIKMTDGKEVVEATHPVLPEYMLFFDIWEPNILWRGNLDMSAMRVTGGQVLTTKKRFGLFPYQEVLATFTAEIFVPGQELPAVDLPNYSDLRFDPPDDFETPYDMQLYPELFDPEYVQWFFASEEAVAKGLPPPPRPKAVFRPDPRARSRESDDGYAEEEESFRSRRSAASSKPSSSTAFGKKK